MNEPWRDWKASLENLGDGPFGDVGRQWLDWIRTRVETLTGDESSASSLLGQGATIVKSVLDGRSEPQSAETEELLREVLQRLQSVESRLDGMAENTDDT